MPLVHCSLCWLWSRLTHEMWCGNNVKKCVKWFSPKSLCFSQHSVGRSQKPCYCYRSQVGSQRRDTITECTSASTSRPMHSLNVIHCLRQSKHIKAKEIHPRYSSTVTEGLGSICKTTSSTNYWLPSVNLQHKDSTSSVCLFQSLKIHNINCFFFIIFSIQLSFLHVTAST